MYYLDTGDGGDTRFRNAVLLALVAHAALVLGVSFSNNDARNYNPQIEVTLATRPSLDAPENTRHIAQANQEGSGNEAQIDQFASTSNVPASAQMEQRTTTPQPREQAEARREVLTTTAMARQKVATDRSELERRKNSQEGVGPEIERINEEIATLQAALDRDAQAMSSQPRVRRLTAASARQSADAAYLLDWRKRLEAVGNKYYPQASVRYGIYGDLRMLVIIRHDGTLEDIQVLSSSGYAVLDEAAIKIVRMAAPYSPFPKELRATTDKLEIVRTWHFQENTLSSP